MHRTNFKQSFHKVHLEARGGDPIFRCVVVSRMDATVLWTGDAEIKVTKSKARKPRVRYGCHVRQMEGIVGEVRLLSLASHGETLKVTMALVDAHRRDGVLPQVPADLKLSHIAACLLGKDDVGASTTFEGGSQASVDSAVADGAADEAMLDVEADGSELTRNGGFLFRRNYQSPFVDNGLTLSASCVPGLGEQILRATQNRPVITIGGHPGAGKTKKMPVSLLATLLHDDQGAQHGVAVIMDQKEAQNALYDHLRTESEVLNFVVDK